MENKTFWKIITVVELVVAAVVVLLDLFLPTIVILGMIVVSLLIRREHIRSLGFKRPQSWARMIGFAFIGVVFLQLFDVGVVLPIMNRLTGTTIDYSGFANLKGNIGAIGSSFWYFPGRWRLWARKSFIAAISRNYSPIFLGATYLGFCSQSGFPACCSVWLILSRVSSV
ncbi:MAG: hypothetical protein M0C28_28770 [Candidatus Moduliflexus flocculans]|nr:hypothetical protein [Candidatus Moduliflexus flocculans]